MEKMGVNDIREAFLSFWESKGCLRLPSFSLVPQHDKSLLIINSGMAPMKPWFSGAEEPPRKRVTTCQKCIRTMDIENVGVTARHGTFFEMMGNFSFGDYFKDEAIAWAWEFSIDVLKLPEEKLWVTIYENDDEAHDIWRDKIGVPEEKIVRLGKEDNFWEIGTGPCGPCSEIYYDRGPEYGCGKPDCKPGCDCDRYIEYWNLVFTQFDAHEDGTYTELSQKNIDTGLGLERMSCIMQGVDSIFDIDTVRHIISAIEGRCNVKYGDGKGENDVSIRVITDHIRSATFMIADHIMPSNEGRGYVLRRLIRRAARNGRKMNVEGAFLADIADAVIDVCQDAYPELKDNQEFIKKIIGIEEDKFYDTLDQGMEIIAGFKDEMIASGKDTLSGDKAFKLHDTYGFPIDITTDIMTEDGFKVDIEGFEKLMEQQRLAGKQDAAESVHAWENYDLGDVYRGKTEFVGYEAMEDDGNIVGIFKGPEPVEELGEGETGFLILDVTPFYATSGGQMCDTGFITADGFEAEVTDVKKINDVFAHKVTIKKGTAKNGMPIHSRINILDRYNLMRNHTATHLLHAALRQVLGEHVHQAGSLVTKDSLRFDFTHYEAMTEERIAEVERIVNQKINEFLDIKTEVMPIREAMASGAMSLFDEKYGDEVRVVTMGDFSKELCGGTHLRNTGLVGVFKIQSESGIAAGTRRIEAVSGFGLLSRVKKQNEIIDAVCEMLKTTPDQLVDRVEKMLDQQRETNKKLDAIRSESLAAAGDRLIDEARDINGVRLITKKFDGMKIDDLRKISDEIKSGEKNVALVLAAIDEGKVTFLVSLTDDVVQKGYHAGKMIKEIAAMAGGGGGGKADMAQAGAKDPSKVEDALKIAEKLL